MKIQHYFDPDTFTLTYLIFDEASLDAIIIDPVLDFDQASGKISDLGLDPLINFIQKNNLRILGILETHAHADHLSSAQVLKQLYPKAIHGVSEKIKLVQEDFKTHFNLSSLKTDGSQFDYLFKDHEVKSFGSLTLKTIPTPGHTPACMSYLIADAVFVGDSLFMPDYGTGRCDFPRGSAKELYHSITKNLYTLPEELKVYVGHDYSPGGREMKFQTTIGESKKNNIQLNANTTEAEYINFRESRDKTLKAPKLLLPSIQVNIDGGHLPQKENNQTSYLKLPLNLNLKWGKLS